MNNKSPQEVNDNLRIQLTTLCSSLSKKFKSNLTFIVMGGFARRSYMFDNNIPINEADAVEGDVDLYINYNEFISMLINKNYLDEEELKSGLDVHYVSKAIYEWYYDVKEHVLSHYMVYDELEQKEALQLKDKKDAQLLDLINNKSLYINIKEKSLIIPLTSKIQLIIRENIEHECDKFDMDCAKFKLVQPFHHKHVSKCSELSDDRIYYIDSINIASNVDATGSPLKVIKRLEKYSSYGFFISEQVISTLFKHTSGFYEQKNSVIKSIPYVSGTAYY